MNISEEIKSAMPAVMERIKRDTLNNIERAAVQAATEVAVQAAKDWAIEHLVPEIKAQLEAGKSSMVVAAQDATKQIGAALTDALVANVTKTLTSSHSIKSIADVMFRGY